jgi:xylulose-5-phosphate/fructose-6-phosphate phosphoketolase
MLILRTPKGWTGPRDVDGVRVEGTYRAHQVPLSGLADNPERLRMLAGWLRSYSPDTLFDAEGRLVPELRALAPEGDRRMSATPYANGGRLREDLPSLDLAKYEVAVRLEGYTLTGRHSRRVDGWTASSGCARRAARRARDVHP